MGEKRLWVAVVHRGMARKPARKRAPAPRIRLGLDERRAQLLELGSQVFAERTYDEVSIDDIARAAGVSKGLLYHYYPTKRDFYLAGLRRTADELVAKVLAASEGKAPIDRVRAGLDAYLDHVLEQAAPFVALMRGGIGSDPEVAAVIEDTRGRLLGRIMTDGAGHPRWPTDAAARPPADAHCPARLARPGRGGQPRVAGIGPGRPAAPRGAARVPGRHAAGDHRRRGSSARVGDAEDQRA